ncbi:MAG: AraC family transcriptional regulator [Phycisphaerales bacterium]|nr:AraC family transcriptional regulator [Phycisphaerales bacterium]
MRTFSSRTYEPESPLVRTQHLEIGEFHASPLSRDFETIASPFDRPHFVFPSSPVVIELDTGRHFVADRGCAVMYPANLPYRRYALSDRGDHCMWIAPTRSLLSSETQFGDICRRLAQREIEPFRVRIPNDLFLEQRTLLYALINGNTVYDLDSRLLRICGSLARQKRLEPHEITLANRIEEMLAEKYEKKTTLMDVAQTLDVTCEHICRLYRKSFATTIHQHVIQLRTRDALERILEGESSLMKIAIELGFNSHTHFTATMRTAFGRSPSQIRSDRSFAAQSQRPGEQRCGRP